MNLLNVIHRDTRGDCTWLVTVGKSQRQRSGFRQKRMSRCCHQNYFVFNTIMLRYLQREEVWRVLIKRPLSSKTISKSGKCITFGKTDSGDLISYKYTPRWRLEMCRFRDSSKHDCDTSLLPFLCLYSVVFCVTRPSPFLVRVPS